VILIPVVGGMIVGIMAKYGTPKIKGHGIPKAMEAVLVNRSRIAPRVAILKPSSAAIAIGTGGSLRRRRSYHPNRRSDRLSGSGRYFTPRQSSAKSC
jgi:hypothetical protein